MAARRTTAHRPSGHHRPDLPTADARGAAVVYPGLLEDLSAPSRARATVWYAPEQRPSVDSCLVNRPASDATRAGRCAQPVRDRAGETPHGDRDGRQRAGRAGAGAAASGRSACTGIGTGPYRPPCGPDGTARRVGRPHDPTAPTRHYRGKKTCHTVKHVLLLKAVLTILFLSATSAGSTHDKRIADATPSP